MEPINQSDSEKPRQRVVLIGESKAAEQMREFAQKAAATEANILLLGETGAGKDHLAEYIHGLGRNGYAFVPVDCGALTFNLSEAELFGHTGDAFTGAQEEKAGLVKIAEQGTLFFNEVANMCHELQVKFLRILEKKTYRSVGGRKEIEVNTRIIAATNADLAQAVKKGKLRLDLYHRLNTITFKIPPLRERSGDIRLLAEYFLHEEKAGKNFSPDALAVLTGYHWPGNIRELKNAVDRAVFFSGEEKNIGPEHIEPYLAGVGDMNFPSWRQAEKKYLRDILRQAGGNLAAAAKIAEISPTILKRKIKENDLETFIDSLGDSN
ncbi:MAG: sigma-54 dependent transcriptional regulator [Patescibacteria group bacterium]|nr:sigma-54 dependent transcriptional regulator [Patescibacteria group bacterium]